MTLLYILIIAILLLAAGAAVIFWGKKRKLKWPFFLVGGALIGFVLSVLLHNFLSALLKVEEPFFFCLAVFICPVLFLIGAAGILFTLIKNK